MLPNYLILTPDGVGSTYLQRTLNVHLNSIGLEYWNTHELLNGLAVMIKDGSYKLHKNWELNLGYSQSIKEICNHLTMTNNNLVSRIAQYHITNRNDDCEELYNTCNKKFNKIIFCARNPLEYALSWGIRQRTDTLNVYSILERKEIHENIERTISVDFFMEKLEQYKNYEYWAYDNFQITDIVNYEDLHYDPNAVMQSLTSKTTKLDFLDYNRTRYNASKGIAPSKDSTIAAVSTHRYINSLIAEKKMPNGIPIKMNTMADKKKTISNFEDLLNNYNSWTTTTNTHTPLSQEDILQSIQTESEIYVT